MLYRRHQDAHYFSQSDGSASRTNYYLRILALASIDILFTLPIGVVSLVLNISEPLEQGNGLPFYPGWALLHDNWEPQSVSYAEVQAAGTSTLVELYLIHWTSPVLAFAIFGFFGLTTETRASYRRAIRAVFGRLGWNLGRSARNARSTLDAIEFGMGPQEMSTDAAIRCVAFPLVFSAFGLMLIFAL